MKSEYLGWSVSDPLKEKNLVRIFSIGDGNCFFHSIISAFYIPYRKKEIDRRKFIVEVRKCLANRLTDKDENGIMIYDKLSRGTLREHSKEIPQFSLDFMQKELKSNVAVDNIYLEFVSDEFDKDIYIIDEKKRDVYITGMDLDILYKKRHSILLLYNGYHYDLLGKINDDEIITLFDPRDPLIKRIRKNIRNSVKKGK